MTFCSIVGHARRQTAAPIGPSTIERSNRRPGFGAGMAGAASAEAAGRVISVIGPVGRGRSYAHFPWNRQRRSLYGNSDNLPLQEEESGRVLNLMPCGHTPMAYTSPG